MRPITLLTFLLPLTLFAQPKAGPDLALDRYDSYKETSIKNRRFKHADIQPLITKIKSYPGVEVRNLGASVEGRSIQMIRIGNGPVKVMLWSQMHGDEATATMAIFDLFNFFRASDELDPLRKLITDNLSLYLIPMLNPDGAQVFTRRNALGIDLNRDAQRLNCPESRILKQTRDEIQPSWGFNLHDQSRYYSAGRAGKSAVFSFLAPAFNEQKDVNDVRLNAMLLTGVMRHWIESYLPGQVAKYDDTFEPRAFGDNMQKWGTSTILIECGGLDGDPEKQQIRKLHFGLLLAAFESIARQSYSQLTVTSYLSIPQNQRDLYDLLVREATWTEGGKTYVVDLGFHKEERLTSEATRVYYAASLAEFGDLSVFCGYEEVNAAGLKIEPGKLYPVVLDNLSQLKAMSYKDLHLQGYTDVRLREMPYKYQLDDVPFRLHKSGTAKVNNSIRLGGNPSFFLTEDGARRYAVVNGDLYPLKTE